MGHTDNSVHMPFTLPLLEWIDIPAGRVTLAENMGTHDVAPFTIAKYLVTNAQYDAFIADGGYTTDRYWEGLAQRIPSPFAGRWSEPDCPRETINWYETMAFTRWLSAKTGLTVILPTEMQWQWAAVGDTGWVYPYGKNFNKSKCNTNENGIKCTTSVTKYPNGASPFGAMDMSGNVREWCMNNFINGEINIGSSEWKSLRGGSWDLNQDFARATYHGYYDPNSRYDDLGFRVVCVGGWPSPFSL